MTTFPQYPVCPQDSADEAIHRRLIAVSARSAVNGKSNNVGEITLTENAASSTLTDPRLTYFSALLFDPMTATAAADLYGGGMYITDANRNNGAFVITHPNTADADKTFRYVIVG